MAESDKKIFYWLKLKKDFFQQHQIKVLKSLPNGRLYALIYLELLAESTSHNGELRFSKMLPYDIVTLATVIDEDKDNLENAIKSLVKLELVEILEDGTIFMQEIKKMIGTETGGAIRKREYRENLKKRDNVPHLSQNCPQENRDRDRDKSIEYRYKSNNNTTTTAEKEDTNKVKNDIYDTLQQYIPEANRIWIDYIESFEEQGLKQELIIYAIKETASKGIRSASYFKEICKSYLDNGYKTLEEIENAKSKYKNKKNSKNNKTKDNNTKIEPKTCISLDGEV